MVVVIARGRLDDASPLEFGAALGVLTIVGLLGTWPTLRPTEFVAVPVGDILIANDRLQYIVLAWPSHARQVQVSLDGNTRYVLWFMRGDEVLARVWLDDTGGRFAGQLVVRCPRRRRPALIACGLSRAWSSSSTYWATCPARPKRVVRLRRRG